jgi:hypothetical protein
MCKHKQLLAAIQDVKAYIIDHDSPFGPFQARNTTFKANFFLLPPNTIDV